MSWRMQPGPGTAWPHSYAMQLHLRHRQQRQLVSDASAACMHRRALRSATLWPQMLFGQSQAVLHWQGLQRSCPWHLLKQLLPGLCWTLDSGQPRLPTVQESLLGGYIALQIAFMYAHHLTWKYLPTLQRSYALRFEKLCVARKGFRVRQACEAAQGMLVAGCGFLKPLEQYGHSSILVDYDRMPAMCRLWLGAVMCWLAVLGL